MRPIDADALNDAMFRKSFETDDGRQQWNGGLWIRYKVFEEARDEAPTIDIALKWIPCEEMAPKKEIPYQRRGYYLTTNAYGNVDLTRYEFEDDFQKTGWQSDIRIVAWMPLPKPYKVERKDYETDRR